MSRLTKRAKDGLVTICDDIVPIGCSRPSFCSRKSCPNAKKSNRKCPFLQVIDKLADLEDQIETGSFVPRWLIVVSDGQSLDIKVSSTHASYVDANSTLTLMYDAYLRVSEVTVKNAMLDDQNRRFFVEYTNGEKYSAQIIEASNT